MKASSKPRMQISDNKKIKLELKKIARSFWKNKSSSAKHVKNIMIPKIELKGSKMKMKAMKSPSNPSIRRRMIRNTSKGPSKKVTQAKTKQLVVKQGDRNAKKRSRSSRGNTREDRVKQNWTEILRFQELAHLTPQILSMMRPFKSLKFPGLTLINGDTVKELILSSSVSRNSKKISNFKTTKAASLSQQENPGLFNLGISNQNPSSTSPMNNESIFSNANFLIIDCRYEYEYANGHIEGAVNINSPVEAQKFIFQHYNLLRNKNVVDEMKKAKSPKNFDLAKLYKTYFEKETRLSDPTIIFYCEFSSQRAPNMWSLIRAIDREMNKYPKLTIPNIFLLEGGYCKFNRDFNDCCTNGGKYVEMLDPAFKDSMKKSMCKSRYDWRSINRRKIDF